MDVKSLEPQAFFHWFYEISRIPRKSFKEEKITAFLENFFSERGIAFDTDKLGNVFARLPASSGYEDQPGILFQAHTDMVCRKDEGISFDFDTDPIELIIDGDKLRANGTTLGADNAVGVATMLAIADDPTLPHPALELLFTVCEEQGMVGIKNFDFSKIESRRMVNMDCGDSHVIAVCSTGKIFSSAQKTYTLQPVSCEEEVLTIQLHGGLSGHSSICANKGRSCGANTMGYLLLGASDLRLCELYGSGPIIKDFTATVAVPRSRVRQVRQRLQERFAAYKAIYADTDPGIMMTLEPGSADFAIESAHTENLALLLSLLRTGQVTAEGNDPASIRSLSTVCKAVLRDGSFGLDYLVRSTCQEEQDRLGEYYQHMASALGFTIVEKDRQPVWPENPQSTFRAKFQRVHTALFKKEMELERVAGGIEVIHIVKNIPDMDPIGVAPTARGAHTTGEYMYISQVAPYWELIKAVLADKE